MTRLSIIILAALLAVGCGGESAYQARRSLPSPPEDDYPDSKKVADIPKAVIRSAVRDRDIAMRRYDLLLMALTEAESAGTLSEFDIERWRPPFPSSVQDGTAIIPHRTGTGTYFVSTRPATAEEIEIYQEPPHEQ